MNGIVPPSDEPGAPARRTWRNLGWWGGAAVAVGAALVAVAGVVFRKAFGPIETRADRIAKAKQAPRSEAD